MISRCSGHCCRRFIVWWDKDTTLEARNAVAWPKWRGPERGNITPEEKRLLRMLVPTGEEDGTDYFTCKNFDQVTGDCKIYAERPVMCRDYPNGKECGYEDCTLRSDE